MPARIQRRLRFDRRIPGFVDGVRPASGEGVLPCSRGPGGLAVELAPIGNRTKVEIR